MIARLKQVEEREVRAAPSNPPELAPNSCLSRFALSFHKLYDACGINRPFKSMHD